MLAIGTTAPPFLLPNQDGMPVSLASLLERGPLILYFYPADFTPGCTREACFVRDMHAELATAGLQVVGISPQAPETHRAFRERYALPHPLLSDPEKRVIRAYGADGPFGLGVRRATFLIAPDGRVRDALCADFRIGRHEEFMRRALNEAR